MFIWKPWAEEPVLLAYFYYSGTIEERNLTATFPQAYPEYKSRTKMLIPFLLQEASGRRAPRRPGRGHPGPAHSRRARPTTGLPQTKRLPCPGCPRRAPVA